MAGTDSINHLKPTGDQARNGSPARSANGSEEEDVNENGKITDSPKSNEEYLIHNSCPLNNLIRLSLLNQGHTISLCMQFFFPVFYHVFVGFLPCPGKLFWGRGVAKGCIRGPKIFPNMNKTLYNKIELITNTN